mmetsp:Transcript_8356/g.9767  ORF Transcript_8356/g.9767 Transcript_8356/m.9767 type:complete len:94 (+) Transcript_8356:343-624(+)
MNPHMSDFNLSHSSSEHTSRKTTKPNVSKNSSSSTKFWVSSPYALPSVAMGGTLKDFVNLVSSSSLGIFINGGRAGKLLCDGSELGIVDLFAA